MEDSRDPGSGPATEAEPSAAPFGVSSPWPRRLAIGAFALSGAAALIYEVVWTRELGLVFGSTVYAVSMMLSSFMAGLSLGSFLGGRIADKARDLFAVFSALEFGIAVFGMLSIPLIGLLPQMYFGVYDALHPSFALFFVLQLLLSFVVMLVPTTLMGASFPVVSRIAFRTSDSLGVAVGDAYSSNTVGSIFGSLAAGFLLIPTIGIRGATLTAAGLNMVVAILMFVVTRRKRSGRGKQAALVAAGAAAVVLIVAVSVRTPVRVFGFYDLGRMDQASVAAGDSAAVLFLQESVYSRVAVFETPDGSRFLQNGGMTEGSNDIADLRTTQLLAALPLYSASAPKSALVIGLGTGYTSRALLDTSLERVDTVEINPAVVPAARYFIGESAEKDPRWKLHVADARNYLLQSNQRWDIVTSEPSWPLSSGVTSLFTKEFFVLSRQRLTPDGVFCQWLPRSIMSKDDFEMMYKTFASVYPNCQVWGLDGAMPDSELMLIGVNGDVRVDDASVRRQADERLTSGGLPDTSFHLFDRPEIMADALTNPSVPFNTDDRPLLQFSLARGRIQLWADAAQAR